VEAHSPQQPGGQAARAHTPADRPERRGVWRTGAVHARMQRVAAREWVGDEFLGAQVRPLDVAARHLDAADHQLAQHAHRQQLEVLVQHVAAQVGQRHPDGYARAALEVPRVIACMAMQDAHSVAATHASIDGPQGQARLGPPVDPTVTSVGP